MSAVIVVFCVWFALVILLGVLAVSTADRWRSPRWANGLRNRYFAAVDGVIPIAGRVVTAATVLLALWSAIIIIGLILGILAHRLQGVIDEPAFRWWQSHHLGGTWSDVWWKLTNIGKPRLTQGLAAVAAIVFAVLYRHRRFWWAPSVTMIVGYIAEKYSQQILKVVINRGHPPTAGGTWPSGGMGRVTDVYGLIIFFVIWYFRPNSRRAWAVGLSLLALAMSIQAYARINNLEHWITDVIGGTIYGVMLLVAMIIGYRALSRDRSALGSDPDPTLEPRSEAAAV